MEWITDTKTGYDDLEVYMEYGYVFVSSTGRNDVKMAAFSFNFSLCFIMDVITYPSYIRLPIHHKQTDLTDRYVKYTWSMNMCLSVQQAEMMSKWRLSALISPYAL